MVSPVMGTSDAGSMDVLARIKERGRGWHSGPVHMEACRRIRPQRVHWWGTRDDMSFL